MRLLLPLVFAVAYAGYCLGFSSETSISADRSFATLNVPLGQSTDVTFQLDNDGENAIRGFYYTDNIPAELIVNTLSVQVDGETLTPSEYTYETGGVGSVYSGCRPYRWIIETPPGFAEDNPVSQSVVIRYSVSDATGVAATYEFPGNEWAGNVEGGTGNAFGYDDDAPTLTFALSSPEPQGTPVSGPFGLAVLALLLSLAVVFRDRLTTDKRDVL